MRIENLVINCTARYPRTCRRTPFEVVVYELNYSSEDKDLMDLLRTKAEELARQVNPGAANNSMHERSPERILADCIAGVVSEYFWKLYLNSEENVVSETEFDDASRQIDLKVISNNKKIEVRSSFPRNGIVQSPNQKIPDRKTKCVIKTHINIKQNVIFGAKLKPV